MSKDPAFLFYPGDWLGGTMSFTRSHKGAYMDVLMAQFNQGHLPLADIEFILGADFAPMWEPKLKAKFLQDENGLWYNKKLEDEMIKRRNYTKSRKDNLNGKKKKKASKSPHMDNHMGQHMENGNENTNELGNTDGNTKPPKKEKPKIEVVLPFDTDSFRTAWEGWKDYQRTQHRFSFKSPTTEQISLKHLSEMAGTEEKALKIIQQSMANGWKGLFELKIVNGKSKSNGSADVSDEWLAETERMVRGN